MAKKKYLFVCKMGKSRSPTAARVAYEIADEKGIYADMFYGAAHEGNVDSVTERHINTYQKIFVMELWMASKIRRIGYKRELRCLNIPDRYSFLDPQLVDILRGKLEKLISP